MRKVFTLVTLCIAFAYGLSAQVLVSTQPSYKNAILEEFTGIHCTYCPEGHAIAQSILDANPGRAFTIAIHQGSFAVPSAGEPDYRTPFGDAIAGQTGLTGYPSGTVNRHVFAGTTTALGRGSWAAACDQIMKEISPVNIGISSEYDAAIRTLTVTVELYYTANATAGTNYINVALTQDSIYGPQTGGGAGSNYRHMHMLRTLITGQWGDPVTTTTAGSLVTRTYTLVVPEAYTNVPAVVENMKVVAFVTRDHQEVYTGDQVKAIGGTNMFIGQFTSNESYIQHGTNGTLKSFEFDAVSNIEGTQPFEIWLERENAPEGWQASFTIDGIEYTEPTVVMLDKDVPMPVTVNVTPDETPGFPGFVVKMRSVTYPGAPVRMYRVMVISNVTDLVVNGTGGPQTTLHQGVYLNGLAAAGVNATAVVNATVMSDMVFAEAYAGLYTIWMNVAWTFPSFTDRQAEALKAFMNDGRSVFVAGQDIGWDIMSGADGSNGTDVTRDLYTNYFKASFIDDGSTSNNKLNANTADPDFGAVAQSVIVDVYGGNMYPDVIAPLAGAEVIFNYNDATKNAAIKYDGPVYRSIYFGVGLEMLSNVAVRNEIINISRTWLMEEFSNVEYNDAVNALMTGQNYPNPASEYTYINLNEKAAGGTLEVYNMSGVRVMNIKLGNSILCKVNVSALPSGIYTYRVVNGNSVSQSRKMSVVK